MVEQGFIYCHNLGIILE